MTKIKKHREINTAAKMIADWRSMMVVHAVHEHGPLRYKELADMLGLSPTVLSSKLAQLSTSGVILRLQSDGAKKVTYTSLPVARDMVKAYHLLESVNDQINKQDLYNHKEG